MKCKFAQCKLGGEVAKEDAIKNNTGYYHNECLQEAMSRREIRELFIANINDTEPMAHLNRTICNILDIKGFESEYLLFALNHVIKNKINLRYVNGLHYIVNDAKILKAYEDNKSKIKAAEIKEAMKEIDIKNKDVEFTPYIDEGATWNKILR
jgi:hypothetical protein